MAGFRFLLASPAHLLAGNPDALDRLHLWLEQNQSLGLWLTALATVGLLFGVIAAGFAVRDARRDRHVKVLGDLANRWAGEQMEASRVALGQHTAEGLKQRVQAYLTVRGSDAEIEVLLRVPNFYEDVAMLVESGALEFDLVWRAFAGPALGYWGYWKDAIALFQARDPGAYIEWGNLVATLSTRPMQVPNETSSEDESGSQEAEQGKPLALQPSGSGTKALARFLLGLAVLSALGRITNTFFRED